MRKLLFILLIAVSACSKGQVMVLGAIKSEIVTSIDWTKTIVFEGDSFTFGHNVDPSERYSTLFVAAKGGTEDNNGLNGQGVQNGGSGCGSFVAWNQTGVPTYSSGTHAALILPFGVNDVMRDDGTYTVAAFKADYKTKVQYAKATRLWPGNKIIILSPFRIWNYNIPSLCGGVNASPTRIAQYNTAAQEVAAEEGCYFFDVHSAMSGFLISDYQSDQIHLNATGHAKLAAMLDVNLN
jgi:lysophospholipase L1-like esterase